MPVKSPVSPSPLLRIAPSLYRESLFPEAAFPKADPAHAVRDYADTILDRLGSTTPLTPSRILPGLYQGGMPLEGSALREQGFGALVLCAKEHQPAAERFPGLRVLHAPNDDADRLPTPQELQRVCTAAAWVAHQRRRGRRVLVTCAAGRNRSGLVTALAISMLTGLPGGACARLVQERRPLALTNPHFVGILQGVPGRRMCAQHPRTP